MKVMAMNGDNQLIKFQLLLMDGMPQKASLVRQVLDCIKTKPEKRIASIVHINQVHPGNTTLEVAAAHVPLGNTICMWHRVTDIVAALTPKVFSATLARLDNFRIMRVNSRKQNRAAGLACRAQCKVNMRQDLWTMGSVRTVMLALMVIVTVVLTKMIGMLVTPTQLTTSFATPVLPGHIKTRKLQRLVSYVPKVNIKIWSNKRPVNLVAATTVTNRTNTTKIKPVKAHAKIAIVFPMELTSTLRVHFTHALNVMVAITYIQAVMSVRYARPGNGPISMDLHMLARTVRLGSTGHK